MEAVYCTNRTTAWRGCGKHDGQDNPSEGRDLNPVSLEYEVDFLIITRPRHSLFHVNHQSNSNYFPSACALLCHMSHCTLQMTVQTHLITISIYKRVDIKLDYTPVISKDICLL